ncbi:MAG TPA: prephenate dehydrogenase/arogenate dehydrogenase family protein [Fervidobacterium sp.]|nr:prephenate dehydrogenase/arogenate dehydrogenase family protein [Fervidobacterium sp.]HPC23955.1 prephenate dehydrogenase/arogenate dehydrogenase family protein [Fervidobacterium sp.]HQO05095.1 prephenate dehydrogenase/arogenate dehydrogenase family protein [Fervidobacterium sp.]HQQ17750.1 prephenate dehydrogenase/arogenate dehydrogenase family protein [Fervidobacterium sp.]
MEMLFENVFIIGTGLIGTSLALAMKSSGEIREIQGYDVNSEHVVKALELGGIDRIGQLKDIDACDLVVLAVPVEGAKDVLGRIFPFLKEGTVVTDVGSTKREIIKAFESLHRCMKDKNVNFIGGHPMAGSEKSGPDGAIQNLFKGKTYVLVRTPSCNDEMFEKFRVLVTKMDASPIEMDAELHDRIVSVTSHLPQVVSYILVQTLIDYAREDERYVSLVGSGFRDTTRLATSIPAVWIDIFKQNKDNLTDVLNHFQAQIEWFKGMIETERYEELNESVTKIVSFKEKL